MQYGRELPGYPYNLKAKLTRCLVVARRIVYGQWFPRLSNHAPLSVCARGQNANDLIRSMLEKPEPCMIARYGCGELEATLRGIDVQREGGVLKKLMRMVIGTGGPFWWDNSIRGGVVWVAGYFPETDEALNAFSRRVCEDTRDIDLLGSWCAGETQMQRIYCPNMKGIPLSDLEPFWCKHPWTGALAGKKVLVTAGPTQEAVDPVRFITNHSSGKMGYAIAHAAALRGAEVTLVSGPVSLTPPAGVKLVPITSARDLFNAVTAVSDQQDIIIKAAAVADYRPAAVSDEKIKKADDDLSLNLERTEDTLQYLGQHKRAGQILCGFAMETSDLENKARGKLAKKNLDMIVANNVKVAGAGFGTDTNVVTFITPDDTQQLEIMTKENVAMKLLDRLITL